MLSKYDRVLEKRQVIASASAAPWQENEHKPRLSRNSEEPCHWIARRFPFSTPTTASYYHINPELWRQSGRSNQLSIHKKVVRLTGDVTFPRVKRKYDANVCLFYDLLFLCKNKETPIFINLWSAVTVQLNYWTNKRLQMNY